jgi:D-alanyl-D-alanine carboxypeptidase (penicillin-binding protein 5/6)
MTNLISFRNVFKNLIILFTIFFGASESFANEVYQNLNRGQYYFLMDIDNKEILLSKNADERISPSSMTKLMTAYVVFDQIKKGVVRLDNRCMIGKDAWRKTGSSMFLNYGDVVSIEDLLKGLLAVSANDAAIALAQTTSSNYESFIGLMNSKARELNMKNSHFMNPHGLHEEGHYMSLRDLSTLAMRLYEDFPEYSKFLSIPEFTYRNITQRNRNPLIKKNYDGILGGKTGHTNQGGYGIVGIVKRENRRLVAVVNKAPTPKIRENIITELFDYGFENYKKISFFEKGAEVANIKVWLGNKRSVEAIIKDRIDFNIPRSKSINDIKVQTEFKSPLYAPIKKDSKIGVLSVSIKGSRTIKYDLYAKENIDKVGYIRKIKRILEYKINNLLNQI